MNFKTYSLQTLVHLTTRFVYETKWQIQMVSTRIRKTFPNIREKKSPTLTNKRAKKHVTSKHKTHSAHSIPGGIKLRKFRKKERSKFRGPKTFREKCKDLPSSMHTTSFLTWPHILFLLLLSYLRLWPQCNFLWWAINLRVL